VSPVRYELGFYIPEDGILHSQGRENLKSYKLMTQYSRIIEQFRSESSPVRLPFKTFGLASAFSLFLNPIHDRLCGLVFRVPGCSPRCPGLESRR
jgi:hypothetical protein